jgi:two-component sensor histidine kinase
VLVDILQEFEAIFGDRVRLASSSGDGCRLQSSQLALLALAFCEIITNALKHAHPTGLPVEFTIASARRLDGSLVLEIADDGMGLPELSTSLAMAVLD